jgi:chemotaxis protein MotB
MAKKAKHEEHENLERWLVSYADFITLLFTFFVMMYAISAVNTGKYKVLSHAIVATFNHQAVQSHAHIIIPHNRNMPGKASPRVRTVLFKAMQLIQEKSSNHGSMKVVQTSKGIRIRIQAAFLFDSGHAKVKETALPTLQNIAAILAKTKRPIRVEGHTDNVPIRGRYSSNWALSTMRAVNVLTYLIRMGPLDPVKVSAAGYSQYHPLVPNDTAENRQKNRRVEIVIMQAPEPSLPSPAPIVPIDQGAGSPGEAGRKGGSGSNVPAMAPPVSTDLPAPRI